MPIDTGLGFISTRLGGHGGVVTYDNKGSTQYYEYGRYKPTGATGHEGSDMRVSVELF